MKLWIKAVCIAFVLSVIYSFIPFEAGCVNISNEVFRLHIPANSDSAEDQALKLKVRDRVLRESEKLFSEAGSKREAERAVADNLQLLADCAADEIAGNGYAYPVKAELCRMYFPTRKYDAFTLPAGCYDSLRITIGEGKGHNWWCVMYPSICLSAASDQDERAKEALSDGEYKIVKDQNIEYKFKLVEIIEQIKDFFGKRGD